MAVVRSTTPSAIADGSTAAAAISGGTKYRYTTAAKAPPSSGATMKSHTCDSALSPTISAGPRLRAGLTEVPVSGIPIRCTTVSASPMARPAKPGEPTRLVAISTTSTQTNVSTTSVTKADQAEAERRPPPRPSTPVRRFPVPQPPACDATFRLLSVSSALPSGACHFTRRADAQAATPPDPRRAPPPPRSPRHRFRTAAPRWPSPRRGTPAARPAWKGRSGRCRDRDW